MVKNVFFINNYVINIKRKIDHTEANKSNETVKNLAPEMVMAF